ncbi:MAG TPA: hypothetical protein VG184_01085 [Acidimicrobiales bacterium]|nr:hypothetical protein [Acidimicrobiales bacterium]
MSRTDTGESAASGDVGVAGVPSLKGDLARDLAAAAMALARRFAAGATLWCWSPRWPEHAQHVAVEFVHPVIMGTRALPATAVEDPDPIATLRTLVSSGDVLLVLGAAGDGAVRSALSRAQAWGATTIWIGAGPRAPQQGSAPGDPVADHVLWFDEGSAEAPYNGAFVLAYHVLWELTHVCFEHPGLMKAAVAECVDDDHCITCSDEATLGEVMGSGPAGARVRTAAGVTDVDTTLVDPVDPGDLLLIHAGVAISSVDGGGA